LAGEWILVVDDEPQVRKLLETFLIRSGFKVVLAADGLEALELLREGTPHLVITDVTMPNLNGLELTRRLRMSHKTARIPILMLSALKQESDVLAGYAQGADDYIGKPVELTILKAKIDMLLRRASAAATPQVEPGKVIAFMHGKGGVGASTLAVNTAIAMVERSPGRVSVLDLNLTFSNTHLLMDVRSLTPLTRLAELHGDVDEEAFDPFVAQHPSGVRLVVANNVPVETEFVSVPAVQLALDRLKKRSDYVLVDLPANFAEHTLAAIDAASVVLLVTANRLSSMKAARDCLDVLNKILYPPDQVKLVLNNLSPVGLDPGFFPAFFKRPPDEGVSYSELFDPAADHGRPLVLDKPDSVAAADIKRLAAWLERVAHPAPRA
jgi:DNA-binding response OmpR family regulator